MQLIFFGYCNGTILARVFNELAVATGNSLKLPLAQGWHTSAAAFENEFFYEDEDGRFILYSTQHIDQDCNIQNRWIYGAKNPPRSGKDMQPRLGIPLTEDEKGEYIYCFVSPFFECGKLYSYVASLKSPDEMLSYNALCDCLMMQRASMFRFMIKMKNSGLKFFVVEGQRLLPHGKLKGEIHGRVVNTAREIIKRELRRLEIPLVELPEMFIDDNGFLKKELRRSEDEWLHGSDDFYRRYVKEIQLFLNSHPEYLTPTKGAGWREKHPPPPVQHHDAEYNGLLTLLKLRDESHSRLLKINAELRKKCEMNESPKTLPARGAISVCELRPPNNKTFFIKGWFIPTAIIKEVTVHDAEGKKLGTATLGLPRPDVARNFRDYKEEFGGWEFQTILEHSPEAGNAFHVQVLAVDGKIFKFEKLVTTKEDEARKLLSAIADLKEKYPVKNGDFLSRNIEIAKILGQFNNSGVEVVSFHIDESDFNAWRVKIDYEKNYPEYANAFKGNLREKMLQHYLTIKHADIANNAVHIDIASSNSVFPDILKRHYAANKAYRQDIQYPDGLRGDKIGCFASKIPLDENSVDYMTLHCSFEHFEGGEDISFLREAGRLLKPGGKVCITPLYMAEEHAIVTSPGVWARKYKRYHSMPDFDPKAVIYIDEGVLQRQFKFFSVSELVDQILKPFANQFTMELFHYPSASGAPKKTTFSMLLTKKQ